jgi:hypothetical protein
MLLGHDPNVSTLWHEIDFHMKTKKEKNRRNMGGAYFYTQPEVGGAM